MSPGGGVNRPPGGGLESWVRRFTVDETRRHPGGFTLYKITSVLFPLASPEAVTVVCVWKRYSDTQRLQRDMRALHTALHLPGTVPTFAKWSYFRRLEAEVVEERRATTRRLLEFCAEHRLLFTSAEFVNFLQSGYEEPAADGGGGSGVIASIRSALRLPPEPAPPLEYDDELDTSHAAAAANPDPPREHAQAMSPSTVGAGAQDAPHEAAASEIRVYEATDVECDRRSPSPPPPLPPRAASADSLPSGGSWGSGGSGFYDELEREAGSGATGGAVAGGALPDLITFDVRPQLDDYHTMRRDRSFASTPLDPSDGAAATDDSYVFEAGYTLSLGARCEDLGDYARAFHCYKQGIERMLLGVQGDPDPHRRSIIKEKTSRYLAYAEAVYRNHLSDDTRQVIRKIPNNLTEFDEFFSHKVNDTRAPILPTNIPYMVQLRSYVETPNLYFLVVSHAPGGRLLDHIAARARAPPPTTAAVAPTGHDQPDRIETNQRSSGPGSGHEEPPARLECGQKICDTIESPARNNDECGDRDSSDTTLSAREIAPNTLDISVDDLVINSQRLLLNVNSALSDAHAPPEDAAGVRGGEGTVQAGAAPAQQHVGRGAERSDAPKDARSGPVPRDALPPATVRTWAAQLLLAIQHLHNAGVLCRELSGDDLVLGERGQLLLTYRVGYGERDRAALPPPHAAACAHVAPELCRAPFARTEPDQLADYWSYGALLYQLMCGRPLSDLHSTVFTSHTSLQLAEELPLEAESLLTQLLTWDPHERLGARGPDEVREHPYFRGVRWDELRDAWRPPH